MILSINNNEINEFKDISKAIGSSKLISLNILRDDVLIKKNIQLEFNIDLSRYLLGISNSNNMNTKRFNLIESSYESLILFQISIRNFLLI